MALITADRVYDTSTTTGAGAFTVSGTAQTGYRTFSSVCSTSDTFYYTIQNASLGEWEVGVGTYSSANTVTRTTIISSSNSGSAVSFSAGTKDVFITIPASKGVQADAAGRVGIGGAPAVSFAVSGTDSILVPVGTTAQRPTGATGYLRYNTDLLSFEGYNGTAWGSIGGGATGGSTDHIFYLNDQTISNDYTIPASSNAGTFGPVTIAATKTVTVSSGATWSIV